MMNLENTHDFIIRARTHCQQAIHDVKSGLGWPRNTHGFVRWYIPERKGSLVLTDEVEPTLAFAPATEQQIKETEQRLGFALPPLLRLLYTQIGNGGFGPGFGIIGANGGYTGTDRHPGTIAHRYQWGIRLADAYRQWYKDGWDFLSPDSRDILREDGLDFGEPDMEQLTDDEKAEVESDPNLEEQDGLSPWPSYLLPLCDHGCSITTYIFADSGQVVQGVGGNDLVVAASLEEWLERWLAGEELQFL